jgi:hypothetical protein
MNITETKEFHVSFIKSIVFIMTLTISCMVFVHYLIPIIISPSPSSIQYTSQESQIKPD